MKFQKSNQETYRPEQPLPVRQQVALAQYQTTTISGYRYDHFSSSGPNPEQALNEEPEILLFPALHL